MKPRLCPRSIWTMHKGRHFVMSNRNVYVIRRRGDSAISVDYGFRHIPLDEFRDSGCQEVVLSFAGMVAIRDVYVQP